MAIENYVVVSGLSGVHKLVAPRSNGVIILDSAQEKIVLCLQKAQMSLLWA